MGSFKKLNCLILSFLILLISVFIASVKVEAETIKIGILTDNGIRMRADATTESAIVIDKLTKGTTMTVTGSKSDTKGNKKDDNNVYLWYKVSYTVSGKTYNGYIREDLISVSEYKTDPTFEEQLKEFPASYHDALIKLHAIYPNWTFRADKLSVTFQEAVKMESVPKLKVVVDRDAISWSSMDSGWYNWNNNSFVTTDSNYKGASREILAYYMDPRNFLDANNIYVFMQQNRNGSESIDGVRKILKGTFLENNYSDANDTAYGGDFAAVIMEAAKQSGVSPYFLAITIRQEQGVSGNVLGNGYNNKGTTVYNFFNVNASGKGEQIIINGGNYALNAGWTTRSASIIGGAKFYAKGYLKRGNNLYNNAFYNQDTCFYKNYNLLDTKDITHQYAQNVADSVSSASNLKILSTDYQSNLTFRIPVYANNSLPQNICAKPENSSKFNNYYFNNISVSGLTPSFDRYKYDYNLQVKDDTNIYVDLPSNAILYSNTNFNLVKGDNKITLTVKSQTGYTNDYVINVNATTPCKITISTNGSTETPPDDSQKPITARGDANNDGEISLSDLAVIRLHLMKIVVLKDKNKLYGADVNGDGSISLNDLAAVRRYLLVKNK